MTHHVAEDKQDLHLDVCVGILQGLHDVWQQDLWFSCLSEAQNFLLVRWSKTTLAKTLWSLSTSLLSTFLSGGAGVAAAASWQTVAMGALRGTWESRGKEGNAGEQIVCVPCSATLFSDRPKQADGLVTFHAWKAPQAPIRPLHGNEGIWNCHPTA